MGLATRLAVGAACCLLEGAAAYPSYVACGEAVEAGQVWMGAAAVGSSARTASFTRDGAAVACGSTYEAGSTYAVTLSSTSGEFLFDLAGGAFDDGTCSGARDDSDGAALTAPADGSAMVLVAAWATSYGVVSISDPCVLTASERSAPTAGPSAATEPAPTAGPSAATEPAPTAAPTRRAGAAPTAALAPSGDGPTAAPTAAGAAPTAVGDGYGPTAAPSWALPDGDFGWLDQPVGGAEPFLTGASYCTWSPDARCYASGWPACCDSGDCPDARPGCEGGGSSKSSTDHVLDDAMASVGMVVAVAVLVLFAMVLAIAKRQRDAADREEQAALAEQHAPHATPNQPVNLFAKL